MSKKDKTPKSETQKTKVTGKISPSKKQQSSPSKDEIISQIDHSPGLLPPVIAVKVPKGFKPINHGYQHIDPLPENTKTLSPNPQAFSTFAMFIVKMSTTPAPRNLKSELQHLIYGLVGYANQNYLTLNTFDPVTDDLSSALYVDLSTMNTALEESGNPSVWEPVFSTYASLISNWFLNSRLDLVSCTANSMNQQILFLSPINKIAAREYLQIVLANLTGTPNEAAVQAAATQIQKQFGPPIADLLSDQNAA